MSAKAQVISLYRQFNVYATQPSLLFVEKRWTEVMTKTNMKAYARNN